MSVHKLILDDVFEEALYTLIAIHCSIEDYRLAYLLNKNLGINLVRKPRDLDCSKNGSFYSIFQWEDQKQLTTWSLVSNICNTIEASPQHNHQSLFNAEGQITKTFNLLPEHKTVNYFLKIDNDTNFYDDAYVLNKILKISKVTTAFIVDVDQLRSKDNLIFY
ncbi:IPExxxVDY family protein [Oceanihabitans sp. IOP_32]|uniref:IPExxxVDY family protein n=1 Tax=Oceanihabitans sp. IOP_32 TaxID=2529032 RepID=UPI0012937B70|nr:IPExxxVDY family protein [Oceanihabitans sp. IOP_32]QFZ54325.1 IPExxxVDY family protein [Oceanihabitans sp. IOP_32]